MTVTGRVTYQAIATGFWGIVDEQGKKWRMVNPPSALCKEGLHISAEVRVLEEVVSIFMWGLPVEILSFRILEKY
ncbi:MAG: hypothetical protein RMJ44_02050 [Cytophagales bacterium]|nr:hypothetical protein [Bernardetiaceae bacterium]MDW8209842.1 hypothetical protein [Cytophagales bacterium]